MNFDENNKNSCKNELDKNIMMYPDERVVSFLGRNYGELENNNDKNAIDIGFGSGRHLKLLMDYNFNTYGIDYNQKCIDIANELFYTNPKLKKLLVSDVKDFNSNNLLFDVVIAHGLIFLRTEKEMIDDLKNIKNIMKKDGKIFINFRTKKDINCGKGRRIEKNTYLLNESSGDYKNMLYTFLDIEEVRKMFLEIGLTIEKEERIDYYKTSLEEKHSWWFITARKVD